MKLILKLLLSPFLMVTGALVVILYYLSLVVGTEMPPMVMSIFLFLSLFYIVVALIFRYFFSFFVNSISLKLIGFYITTALVPLILLAIFTSVGVFFAIGISQSYFLNKSIKYNYNNVFDLNEKSPTFDTDHKQLYFKNKDEKKLLDEDFFENLHKFLDFDFAVYTIDLPINKPGLSGDMLDNGMKFEANFEKLPKVFSKIFSTDDKIVVNDKKLNNFSLDYSKLSYPIIYSLNEGEYDDKVVFLLQINASDLMKNFFYSKSSFSKYNRLVARLIASIALALFAFQVYLFFRGVFYMSTISSSAGLLKKGANEIAAGNFDYRIGKLKDKQLDDIGESFNLMASNIKKLISQLVKKQQLEHEFQIARKIQESALSVGFHKENSVGMAVFSEPSKEVGGDYFNFIKRDDGITILAGDVSGKGIGAAMYVSEINGLFSAMVSKNSAGMEIAEALHRFFLKRGEKKVFFTASLLEIDFKSKLINYFRLGDPPLMAKMKTGNWEVYTPAGIPAGMRGVSDFKKFITPQTINIDEIELLFSFSDGFYEVMHSSESEILENLEKCYHSDSKVFYNNLVALPQNQEGDKDMLDDVTFAIITFG